MADYGLLAEGFVPMPTVVIREEINTEIRGFAGASIDLSDRALLGFIVGIIAERFGKHWELTEAVNSSQDPDKATDAALDAILTLTGTFRAPARPSTVTLTLTGTPTTVVNVNSEASAESTGATFRTDDSATLEALTAWDVATAYVVGDRRTNSGHAYVCITAGTSAGSGGPTTTDADITDNTAHWRYMGVGTGAADVDATCTVDGATVATSGDITEIETPVSGWESVINLLDADLGNEIGTNEAARLQRGIDLAAPGTSPVDAITEALLRLDDVTNVRVFANNTETTDILGIPSKRIMALVQGGADQDILDCLRLNVAAGIGTHGNVDGISTDSQGNAHAISFSRPEEIAVWASLDAYFDVGETVPADAADQIALAIVSWGDAQPPGKNPNISGIISQAMSVDGVYDTANVTVDTVDPPVGTASVPISQLQLAVWDTSRITVNVLTGTP